MSKNILMNLKDLENVGICSVCSSNDLVIKASMRHAKEHNMIVLIESTSNQVNQFGGYTNMTPQDFLDFVLNLAKEEDFPTERIILGGDHLGPLIWTKIDPSEAMLNAEQLVFDYAKAGFSKIHLDTSMRLRDDDTSIRLSDDIIADRSARLALKVEEGYNLYKQDNPDAQFPVLIIGSEVPIPGGAQEVEEIEVTKTSDLDLTLQTFKDTFKKYNIEHLFENIIGVVVQPGVEFGDHKIDRYNRENAQVLIDHVKKMYPELVLEGHSTDYQSQTDLRKMVEDRVAILKVGPGLTFALREALFNFTSIENLLSDVTPSKFKEVLDSEMLKNPEYWVNHYSGTEEEIDFKRQYSFSDRARYYLNTDAVEESLELLKNNIDNNEIPLPLLSQFFPIQYHKHIEGNLDLNFEDVVIDYISITLDDYLYATHQEKLNQ